MAKPNERAVPVPSEKEDSAGNPVPSEDQNKLASKSDIQPGPSADSVADEQAAKMGIDAFDSRTRGNANQPTSPEDGFNLAAGNPDQSATKQNAEFEKMQADGVAEAKAKSEEADGDVPYDRRGYRPGAVDEEYFKRGVRVPGGYGSYAVVVETS